VLSGGYDGKHRGEREGSEGSGRASAGRAPPQAIRGELEKILASETFRGSEGQRNFLRFSVEQALDGHADQLKEYSIGVQALERNEDFDPRVDPIVRTQASKLRSRLLKYYAGEGLNDPVKIELPKGHYAPVFSASAAVSVPEIEPPVARSWLAVHAWKAVILLVLLAVTGTTAYLRGVARRDSVNFARMNSVAVMPFLTIGGDKQDELFSDGLAEDLVTSLARMHNLRVVARTSTLQFKDKRVDIRTIGRTLNVQGSVRKSGNRLRITAQLVDTSSGYNLWSESYDRDLLDLDPLALQQDLSRAITSALGRVNEQSAHR
jgi:adenylate cyclase